MKKIAVKLGLASFLWLVSPPAIADQITVTADFYPYLEQGRLNGCQVGFTVARDDNEYNGGRPVVVNGAVIVDLKLDAMMIRLGYSNNLDNLKFQPADRAYVLSGLKTNIDSFLQAGDSSEPGFRLFIYKLDDVAIAALANLSARGTIDVAYGPANTKVDARFVVDLQKFEKTQKDFANCMEEAFSSVRKRLSTPQNKN